MYNIEYYRNKFSEIPFDKFCKTLLEDGESKCVLGWLGVKDCNESKWYNINKVEEAKDFNYLCVRYLYPILKSKEIRFNSLLLEQGKIIFAINDNDIKVCLALGIHHNTIKGRILQAISKIEKQIQIEKIINDIEEAEYELVL